jgi:capsular exopolysaccharide synthesis family protein
MVRSPATHSLPESYNAYASSEPGLRQWATVFSRRKLAFCTTFLIVVVLGCAVIRTLKPVYRASANILVPTPPNPKVGRGPEATPVTDLEIVAAARPASLDAQADEMTSEAFLAEARRRAGIKERPGKPLPTVKVTSSEFTTGDTLQVTVDGGSPKEVARLANAMARMQVDQTNQRQSQGIRRAMHYVSREKDAAAATLSRVEADLADFRAHYPVQQWTDEQAMRAKQFGDLRAQLLGVRSKYASTREQVEQLQKDLQKEPPLITSDQVQANPEKTQLETRLHTLRLERVDMLRDFQHTSPEVKALDSQIDEVYNALKAMSRTVNVKTQVPNPRRLVLEPKLAELQAALVGYREDYEVLEREFKEKDRPMEDLGPLKMKQATLEQDFARATQRYQLMADQLQQLELRQSASVDAARVIKAAVVPTSPAAPSKPLLAALTLLGAVALGVAVVLLMEFLDDRVHQSDDLEKTFALPLLGRVPQLHAGRPSQHADLPAMDAYRTLRAGIQFAGVDEPIRLLQVTSAVAGEGKSVTAINLAMAMAMDGKRVTLVDCDLRSPQIAASLALPPGAGLSDCLAEPGRLEDALQDVGVENLTVLAAGPIPPNPPELLGSERFRKLLGELSDRSDVVVLDSAPCLPVPDSVVLSSRVDAVMVVVEADSSRKGELAETLDLLDRAGARVIGGVYNRAPVEKGNRRSYYGGRRYRRTAPRALNGLRIPAGSDIAVHNARSSDN